MRTNCPQLSSRFNVLAYVGNSRIEYSVLIRYRSFPEFPLQSLAVLPRPREAHPERTMP
jgi:hypothetical protein